MSDFRPAPHINLSQKPLLPLGLGPAVWLGGGGGGGGRLNHLKNPSANYLPHRLRDSGSNKSPLRWPAQSPPPCSPFPLLWMRRPGAPVLNSSRFKQGRKIARVSAVQRRPVKAVGLVPLQLLYTVTSVLITSWEK